MVTTNHDHRFLYVALLRVYSGQFQPGGIDLTRVAIEGVEPKRNDS